MGKRGPKPEPAAIKQQKGNAGHRPIGNDPDITQDSERATSPLARVHPPDWLAGEGRKIWDRLAPGMTLLKLLTPRDAEAFARYCRNFARWLKLQKLLDSEDETYESETVTGGTLKRLHPAFQAASRLESLLQNAEDRFGLNPAERQRIFAARSAAGLSGDLFDGQAADGDSQKEDAGETKRSPVGLLN